MLFGRFGRGLLVLAFTAVLAACSTLPAKVSREASTALPPATDTPTARYIQTELGRHPDVSGFRLLTLSTNALMSRVALADHAQHSIDLQYYIFKNDATGRLIVQRLLAAADRGVRVRMLLDHIRIENEIDMLEALDAHPNIEVRLFNPFFTRQPTLVSKATQMLLDGRRLNRRMHNKSFVVDNVVGVVGGRNIGDDYFDAGSDMRFRDLDLVLIGPVVEGASRTFDAYWNDEAAYPVTAFHNTHRNHMELAALRDKLVEDVRKFAHSDYAQAVMEELPDGPTADRWGEWFWGPAVLVADQPEKVIPGKAKRRFQIDPQVKKVIDSAQSELLLISPYLVPGESGTRYLTDLARRGVATKVLTNSLASTDEPAVHAGYVHYRHPLLEAGVQLYELRPSATEKALSAHGASSGVSLHAKAIVVDRRIVFIGSMNMDLRSKALNTEMGVIADCPPLAGAVQQFFETATAPGNAYHVVLNAEPGKGVTGATLQWLSSDDGQVKSSGIEPEADLMRRTQVMLMRLLPIDGLL